MSAFYYNLYGQNAVQNSHPRQETRRETRQARQDGNPSRHTYAAGFGGRNAGNGGPVPALGAKPEVTRAYGIMWLQPGAPLSLVKAAYRALAAHCHPDAGGDSYSMVRLNQAYHTLCVHLTA